MRLDKYLVACGIGSRKEIKALVKNGSVNVNGKTAKKSDMQLDEFAAQVHVNGVPAVYKKYVYLMMNKPQGYVSATEDRRLPTVLDLVPEEYAHCNVFPVGRLDLDTEGLLILTNDGGFAHDMTSPKKAVYKRYFARLDKPMEEDDIAVFASGIPLKDFTAKPAKLEITQNPCEVYISVCEGKFHQVKRMCTYVGKEVLYLKRLSMGDLVLDDALRPGEVKEIFL